MRKGSAPSDTLALFFEDADLPAGFASDILRSIASHLNRGVVNVPSSTHIFFKKGIDAKLFCHMHTDEAKATGLDNHVCNPLTQPVKTGEILARESFIDLVEDQGKYPEVAGNKWGLIKQRSWSLYNASLDSRLDSIVIQTNRLLRRGDYPDGAKARESARAIMEGYIKLVPASHRGEANEILAVDYLKEQLESRIGQVELKLEEF